MAATAILKNLYTGGRGKQRGTSKRGEKCPNIRAHNRQKPKDTGEKTP